MLREKLLLKQEIESAKNSDGLLNFTDDNQYNSLGKLSSNYPNIGIKPESIKVEIDPEDPYVIDFYLNGKKCFSEHYWELKMVQIKLKKHREQLEAAKNKTVRFDFSKYEDYPWLQIGDAPLPQKNVQTTQPDPSKKNEPFVDENKAKTGH